MGLLNPCRKVSSEVEALISLAKPKKREAWNLSQTNKLSQSFLHNSKSKLNSWVQYKRQKIRLDFKQIIR